MNDDTWLEPFDYCIEKVRHETKTIKKDTKETDALAALYRLYVDNDEGMKRLADT
jgi:hypothetical protein